MLQQRETEFVRLLTRHASEIYGFILMLTADRNDADDVFQDASVVLLEKFGEYKPETSFRAWACRIAYYKLLAHRRDKARGSFLSDKALSVLAADALQGMQLESDESRSEALAECLEKLGEHDRQLIEQRYFVSLSVSEIAAQTSRSVHAIYRSLGRIHGILLRCVRRSLEG